MQETETLLQDERHRSTQLDGQVQQLQDEKETLLQNQHQTISLLVSEKASLASELERFQDLEASKLFISSISSYAHVPVSSDAQAAESRLDEEKSRTKSLDELVKRLQAEAEENSKQNEVLEAAEKELTEKTRDQVGSNASYASSF